DEHGFLEHKTELVDVRLMEIWVVCGGAILRRAIGDGRRQTTAGILIVLIHPFVPSVLSAAVRSITLLHGFSLKACGELLCR
ncbi:MAG: hypothetical protein M3R63_03940, partial [Actinomycetota bacterium]|nr:hypothetical protein [Actinomycetota bacterium]